MSGIGWGDVVASSSASSETIRVDGMDDGGHVSVALNVAGWADVLGPPPESVTGTDESECISYSSVSLADYAAPTKKRRGRPPRMLQTLPEVWPEDHSGDVDAASSSKSLSVPIIGPSSCSMTAPSDGDLVGEPSQLGQLALMVPPSSLTRPWYSFDGYAICNLCSSALSACLAAVSENSDVDLDYFKLHAAFVSSKGSYHCSSVIAMAEKLGMSRLVLLSKLCRMACAHVVALRQQKLSLDLYLSRRLHSSQLVAYLESVAYDETPLPTSSKLISNSTCPSSESQEALALRGMAWRSTSCLKSDTVSAKVLQSKDMFGFLILLNGKFVKLVGESVVPLQVLSRANGPVLLEALLGSSCSSSSTQAFNFRSRISMHDQASYNVSAEAMLSQKRSGVAANLDLSCDAHVCSNVVKNTFDKLMPEALSGLIATALSLRHGSSLMMFRAALFSVIEDSLVLLTGTCAPEAEDFRQKAMALFLSGPSSDLVDKVLVSRLPNGDWRRRDRVEFYYDISAPAPSKVYVCNLLCNAVIQALLSSKPAVLARHRWTGMDNALDEIGRLEAIHGLFSRTFHRFMSSLQGPRPTTTTNSDIGASLLASSVDALQPGREDEQALVEPSLGLAGVTAEHLSMEELSQAGLPSVEQHRSVDDHAKDRKTSANWLSADPWTELVVLRVCVEPLMDFMTSVLRVSGEKWEVQQRSELIDRLASGVEDGNPFLRNFQATLAADGVLEERFQAQLGLAFNTSLWALNISLPHRRFPLAAFKGAVKGRAGQTLWEAPDCLLDDWSRTLKAQFPDCSVAFLNFQAGVLRKPVSITEMFLLAKKAMAQNVVKSQPKKLRRRAGLWRAWIRFHTFGQSGRADFCKLSQTYRKAVKTKDPLLKKMGNMSMAARLSSKTPTTKASAFGPATRQLARAKLKQSRHALFQRLRSQGSLSQAMQVNKVLGENKQVDEAIRAARTMMRLQGASKKREEESHWDNIRQHCSKQGQDEVQEVLKALPDLPCKPDQVFALPDNLGITIYMPPVASDEVTKAAAFASHSKVTNLSSKLEHEWLRLHEPLDAGPEPQESMPKTKQACRDAGFCICSA
eukprot:6473263-Amphidinium_carterae.1